VSVYLSVVLLVVILLVDWCYLVIWCLLGCYLRCGSEFVMIALLFRLLTRGEDV